MAGGAIYGTRFDAEIRRGVRRGQLGRDIARELRISEAFVYRRCLALGLLEARRENWARERAPGGRLHGQGRTTPAYMGQACLEQADQFANTRNARAQADARIPSKLLRNLRGRSVDYSRNAIGALHGFGLTVDEIGEITSRHPAFIVDAIKRASACS